MYLDPPEAAVVYCVDEKSQVQALGRSQPAFPMMPGMPEKRTHDYIRLHPPRHDHPVRAFNTADYTVISCPHRRHRTIEFKKVRRRLCMAFVHRLDQDIGSAWWPGCHPLDGAAGRDELVSAIGSLDFSTVRELHDPRAFLEPLGESIAAAMYWQSPHDGDVTAADFDIRRVMMVLIEIAAAFAQRVPRS